MSGGHGHGTAVPGSASGKYTGRLGIGLAILVVSLVVQVVVGLATSSLALLSDAGHNFTDVLGLGMALAAIMAGRRGSTAGNRTFGLYRAEVLAALANAVLLFGVAIWIFVEALRRLADPPEVPGVPILLVGTVGLIANLIVFALLREGAKESINVRGAYLEVIADTLGSVGVLLAGALMLIFGWRYADPIIAVAIGLFILPRTWKLGRQALRILLQAAPEHVDVTAVRTALSGIDGVQDVHDVHIWTLTSGMDVGSAHLRVEPGVDSAGVLTAAQVLLDEGFSLGHVTVQVEEPGSEERCAQQQW